MKKWFEICGCILVSLVLAGSAPAESVRFEDDLGCSIEVVYQPESVISLQGSFAQAYAQAGGTLSGAPEDAICGRGLELGEDVRIIGNLHKPNMEMVLSLSPEFVILSVEIPAHRNAGSTLEAAGIPHAYFSVMNVQEYLRMMEVFCTINGRDDLYEGQRQTVQRPIEDIIARVRTQPDYGAHTALLLRAYSTGVKAKGSDSLAGSILSDMGLVNMADDGVLEDISLETVIALDPDYIFVVMMGSDEEKAMEALAGHFTNNPAWAGLTAVREERFLLLPKDLFNNKPNNRWPESYAMIEEILYAQ